jgi:lipoprotein-anchoring transpeptidase ErfK/SrfK
MQSPSIHISVSRQTLTLRVGDGVEMVYPVSTSRYGLGFEEGTFKTPLGRFEIAEKIGAGAAAGAVFKSRVPTGELGDAANPDDLVQTRILWLHGLDPENANTRDRYIYIHGTNHEEAIGAPASHGCIRMRNGDVIDLFERVAEGASVFIES